MAGWRQKGSVGRGSAAALVLGAVLGALVCFPFVGGGRLLLLDWVLGPHQPIVPSSAYGLRGGLVSGLPLNVVLAGLAHLLGPAMSWLPIFAFFPLASVAVARLVGGSAVARLGAALVYCVNPWVFDRIYVGHIGLLTGYALLPWAVASLLRAPGQGRRRGLAPVLWVAVLVMCSPHFAWITAVVAVVVVLGRRLSLRSLGWLALVAAGVAATSAYLLVGPAAGHLGVKVGAADLAAFRTSGDPRFGLFLNVAGLYGFWRGGPVLAKNVVSGWPFVLVAILVVAGRGAWVSLRQPERRPLAVVVLGAGVLGYLLALGDQGPTGSLFRWAYFHVPLFDVMREPQKFTSLEALAYAVLFGWGVESLAGATSRWALPGALAIAVGLPLAYTPTLFGALNGQVSTSHVPVSWARANAAMGRGSGQILFLPWHQYLSFSFTHGRAVANPAPAFFARPVISGDNVELGNLYSESTSRRSAFFEYVFAHGGEVHDFGALVSALDIRYVVVAKTLDWRRYDWLAHQRDLSAVLDSPSLMVWRSDAAPAVGRRLSPAAVSKTWPSLLARPPRATAEPATVVKRSAVAYDVSPGQPGFVELAEPYQRGWVLEGRPARPLPEGNLGWPIASRAARATFEPWAAVRVGYGVSLAAVLLLAAVVVGDRRRRRE